MDKIIEAKFFVEEVDLISELFVSCLGATRLSSEGTKIVRLKIEDGAEIVLYPSRDIYPEGDKSLKLSISNEKLEKVANFLKAKGSEFFQKDNRLTWGTNNGSFIEFSS